MQGAGGYQAPSVGRALRVLELVAGSQGGLGISELARLMNISKGTVSGICAQLEHKSALVRDPGTKRYALGPLIPSLAGQGRAYQRLQRAAGPELGALRDRLNESVFLGVSAGDRVAILEARQPNGVVGVAAGPGTSLPITAGAVGKVFMAGMLPKTLERVLALGLRAYTPQSITDPQRLMAELQSIREKGYALEREEYLAGVWGAAAGLGYGAGIPAAVWVVGFTSSLQDGAMENAARALLEASGRIRQHLSRQPA